MEGSIPRARPLHENAPHHGRFSIQSGTLHAEARNRGWFHSPDSNPPRFRPESRTVRCKQNQPSTRRLDITDGPCFRSAPSMLMPHFADGSILQTRTLHENAPHHGRFSIQSGTLHAEARNRGWFHSPDSNPPRFRPESRTVRCKQNQPSTRRLDITDGPCFRSAPSMLMPHFADGSILQTRTLHENAPHHGRFSIQSGTIHAEARNRGRFHFPDSFPKPILQTHSPGPNPSAV